MPTDKHLLFCNYLDLFGFSNCDDKLINVVYLGFSFTYFTYSFHSWASCLCKLFSEVSLPVLFLNIGLNIIYSSELYMVMNAYCTWTELVNERIYFCASRL